MSFASDLVRDYRAGRAAAQRGDLRSSCPHPPDAQEPRTRNAFTAWMRGYGSVTPTPVDLSD